MSDELPESVRQEFEAAGAIIRRLTSIVENLDDPLPVLVDSIKALSKDDLQMCLMVAVFGIVKVRAEAREAKT